MTGRRRILGGAGRGTRGDSRTGWAFSSGTPGAWVCAQGEGEEVVESSVPAPNLPPAPRHSPKHCEYSSLRTGQMPVSLACRCCSFRSSCSCRCTTSILVLGVLDTCWIHSCVSSTHSLWHKHSQAEGTHPLEGLQDRGREGPRSPLPGRAGARGSCHQPARLLHPSLFLEERTAPEPHPLSHFHRAPTCGQCLPSYVSP